MKGAAYDEKNCVVVFILCHFFTLCAARVSALTQNSPSSFRETFTMFSPEVFRFLTQDENDYTINAFIHFDYPELSYTDYSTLSRNEKTNRIRDYHLPRNQNIVNKLNIKNCIISNHAAFGEIIYDSLLEYYVARLYLKILSKATGISSIEISLHSNITENVGSSNASALTYEWNQVKTDVGIPADDTPDGTGIKIGVMEYGVPDPNNVYSNKYSCNISGGSFNPSNADDHHATQVMTIIGGPHGLAPDAHIYHSRSGSTVDSFNYFYNNQVNIINCSATWVYARQYDNYAAYIDYFVNCTGIAFIASAGNFPSEADLSSYIGSPGLGINVITVGATNAEKYVAYFSRNGTPDDLPIYKPDFVAPGENLKIPTYTQPFSGTSFSAPIVTAILAKLMDEYASLIGNPVLVRAVLAQSCVLLPTQTSLLHNKAGAGIINYTNARQILFEGSYVLSYKVPHEDVPIIENDFYVSPSSTMLLRFFVQVPVTNATLNATAYDMELSTYRIQIREAITNQIIHNHVYDGSTGYIQYFNDYTFPVLYRVSVTIENDAFPLYEEPFVIITNAIPY